MHEYGLFLGRFQPFHDGHAAIAADALKKCRHLIIAVGSAQESRTKRNPLTYYEREALIKNAIFGNVNVTIVPIEDREAKLDDASWGEYMMNAIERHIGVRPTIVFEGEEVERLHWYDSLDVEVQTCDRNLNTISATKVRQMLLEDDRDSFAWNMPCGTWSFYDELRKIMLEVYYD
jgi:cytidyltransferase-like protein